MKGKLPPPGMGVLEAVALDAVLGFLSKLESSALSQRRAEEQPYADYGAFLDGGPALLPSLRCAFPTPEERQDPLRI